MRNVLFVEDAEEFHLIVRTVLEGAGFHVDCVSTAADAEKQIHQKDYDLVLLDVVLPDSDGFELCRKWQSENRIAKVPVIFVTGQGEIQSKLTGFSLGAEDYIVKPFEPQELRARVEARLRTKGKAPAEIIRKGDLMIRVPYQKAFIVEEGSERDLRLTPVEFKILYCLLSNEGQWVAREKLMKEIWGQDVHVVDQSVYTHVSALRRKLGARASYVESQPRGGYRFVLNATASVSETD